MWSTMLASCQRIEETLVLPHQINLLRNFLPFFRRVVDCARFRY